MLECHVWKSSSISRQRLNPQTPINEDLTAVQRGHRPPSNVVGPSNVALGMSGKSEKGEF